MLDLVVSGGTVVDGTGALGVRTDIGVTGDRITAIGDLAAAESQSTLDATDMIVAPGFIDIHSHSDFTLLVDPRAQSAIAQGVTTEVIGNCGHGCAPLTEPERYWGNIYGHIPGFPTEWRTTAEYLNRMDEGRPAVNIAALVPNGNLRLASVADPGKPATPREVATMVHHLEEGLDAGAFGYSTGLEYDAERASPEDETAALCRVVGQKNGLYATHPRNKEVRAVEAVEEGLRVAKASGARIQVSHIIPRRGGTPNALDRVMDAVESAHSMGIDAACDALLRDDPLREVGLRDANPVVQEERQHPNTRTHTRARTFTHAHSHTHTSHTHTSHTHTPHTRPRAAHTHTLTRTHTHTHTLTLTPPPRPSLAQAPRQHSPPSQTVLGRCPSCLCSPGGRMRGSLRWCMGWRYRCV